MFFAPENFFDLYTQVAYIAPVRRGKAPAAIKPENEKVLDNDEIRTLQSRSQNRPQNKKQSRVRIAFSCALRDLYAGVASMNENPSKETEATAEIQVIIYAGGSYVNKRVASLEEAAALRAEYRSKTPEFSRFSFKCFDPEKVQFDQFGRIIAGGYTV